MGCVRGGASLVEGRPLEALVKAAKLLDLHLKRSDKDSAPEQEGCSWAQCKHTTGRVGLTERSKRSCPLTERSQRSCPICKQ